MAYEVQDGPPDLEAVHQWDPGGTEFNAAPWPINRQELKDTGFPWIKLLGITGWRALPESDDNREPRTLIHGEIAYPGKLLGKTVVYECQIRATTKQLVLRGLTAAVNGFGEKGILGVMTVTPYASIGGPTWTYNARVLDLTHDNAPTWSRKFVDAWRIGFSLSLRMTDPFFFAEGNPYL